MFWKKLGSSAIHPRITASLDRLFLPNYFLNQAQIVNILPGEAAQPLHYDDGFYPVSRPRPALGAATVWAIDEFTEESGATLVIPESHQLAGEVISDYSQAIPVVMPAGSVVFFLGTLGCGTFGCHLPILQAMATHPGEFFPRPQASNTGATT
ncbi:MAG: ectoine hydroxylase-related dioxygenase (phytanoyl-CoA dioxygenase family) [Zhongshania sp.]|jgi:ectoine hydroxylase-related dioxygenase (phytanoyl-CoA dioxygenase family)